MKQVQIDEEAVSPVIGVVLMVAIVVILAAVIAAFVFGMAGGVSSPKMIGCMVSPEGIMFTGGDLASVSNWTAKVNGSIEATGGTPAIGTIYPWSSNTTIINERVIVVSRFVDGSEQVIYDKIF